MRDGRDPSGRWNTSPAASSPSTGRGKSLRLLAPPRPDPDDVAFNLYRFTSFGANPTLLNQEPIRTSTHFDDTGATLDAPTTYTVRAVRSGQESAEEKPSLPCPFAPSLPKQNMNFPVAATAPPALQCQSDL